MVDRNKLLGWAVGLLLTLRLGSAHADDDVVKKVATTIDHAEQQIDTGLSETKRIGSKLVLTPAGRKKALVGAVSLQRIKQAIDQPSIGQLLAVLSGESPSVELTAHGRKRIDQAIGKVRRVMTPRAVVKQLSQLVDADRGHNFLHDEAANQTIKGAVRLFGLADNTGIDVALAKRVRTVTKHLHQAKKASERDPENETKRRRVFQMERQAQRIGKRVHIIAHELERAVDEKLASATGGERRQLKALKRRTNNLCNVGMSLHSYAWDLPYVRKEVSFFTRFYSKMNKQRRAARLGRYGQPGKDRPHR